MSDAPAESGSTSTVPPLAIPSSVEDIEPGDHLFVLYDDPEESLELTLPAVREALRRGDRCLWMGDEAGARRLRTALRSGDGPLSGSSAADLLTIRTDREAVVGDDGLFDADAFAETVTRHADDGPLWLVNDMAWAGSGDAGAAETRAAVEAWADSGVGELGVVAICQYDRNAIDDDEIVELLEGHPLTLRGVEVLPNPYYRPFPDAVPDGRRARVEWMMGQLRRAGREAARLRRRERELDTVLSGIPDAVVRMGPDLRFRFVSDVAARLMGVSAAAARGRTLREVGLDPERWSPWTDAVRETFEAGEPRSVEEAVEMPDGVQRWFRSRAIPETDDDGEVESVLVIGEEVSEARRAREELRGTVRLLRRILSSLDEAVFVVSGPDRTVSMCNEAATRIFGYDRSAIVGHDTRRLHVDEESYERFGRESRAVLAEGRSYHGSFWMRRADGSTFPTEHTVTLLHPSEGVESDAVSVVRDASEAGRIGELLDSLKVGVVRATGDGTVRSLNRAGARILRLDDPQAVVGRPAEEELWPGERWSRIVEAIRAGPDATGTVRVRIRRRDGTPAWVAAVGRIVTRSDGVEMVEGVFQDVTEEARLRREVVEISDQERRRIGQDLHDDLGQHLTGLAFLARDMGRRLASDGRPEADDARQLERLANEAVVKTRLLARGVQPPALRHRGLAGALRQLADEVEELFGLELSVEVDEDVPTVSTAEMGHLYRIVQEATTNAVRHGRAERVCVRLRGLPGGRVLEVEDDGAGFDPSEVATGLGLRIMRYRARLVRAELDIRSRPGDGTTVRCDLPPVSLARAWDNGEDA